MQTLVAIGGGSFQQNETFAIDEYIISRTKKEHPKVIFIPAASNDDQGYAKRFKQFYRSLGCEVEAIRLWHTKLFYKEIANTLLEADVIYFGGGETALLMQALDNFNLFETIKEAYQKGIVIAGLSAGANILFSYGYSDCQDGYQFVQGMELEKGLYCPHHQRKERQSFQMACQQYPDLPIYPCQDQQAVCIEDGQMRILDAK